MIHKAFFCSITILLAVFMFWVILYWYKLYVYQMWQSKGFSELALFSFIAISWTGFNLMNLAFCTIHFDYFMKHFFLIFMKLMISFNFVTMYISMQQVTQQEHFICFIWSFYLVFNCKMFILVWRLIANQQKKILK